MRTLLLCIIIIISSCRSTKTIDKKSNIVKNIYFDTTWSPKNHPITISGNLWIAGPAKLKIMKGTLINLKPDSLITVEGSIIVEGTPNEQVIFTGTNLWEHIHIKPSKNNSVFTSAIFRNARGALFIENTNVEINNCFFEKNNTGVFIKNASPTITKNLFMKNQTGIMSTEKNGGLISRNSFEGNQKSAIHGLDQFHPQITKNVFINNNFAILIKFTNKSNKATQPEIEFNDFAKNTKFNIFLENFPSDIMVNAPSNFMDSLNKNKGPLNLSPILKSPQFIHLN